MTITFRPAIKSEAKPLIGLYSESGCGKTLSALYLARGFAGPTGRIGMIETEAGRGEAYAEVIPGSYGVFPLRENYSPRDYGDAITAAEKAELAALIIDSGSHEWEALGGVLHMAAQNQEQGKKGPLVWQGPKLDHRRHFIQRLISTPIPLVILCMRARYPMREDKAKKEWVRSDQLVPMQSEDILFEMFVHGWIDREHRFRGTKYTLDELREVIRDGEPISLETGKRLAAWARGGAQVHPASAPPVGAGTSARSGAPTVQLGGDLNRLATKLKLTREAIATYKRTHLGDEKAKIETADLAAVTDLCNALRSRAGEPKWGQDVTPPPRPVSKQPGAVSSGGRRD